MIQRVREYAFPLVSLVSFGLTRFSRTKETNDSKEELKDFTRLTLDCLY